jgi:hypothetical protein
MKFELRSLADFGKTFLDRLAPGRNFGPIDSLTTLEDFTTSRAAFIAQKTMYGYVKTRMGTSYPEMFRDNDIAHSVRIATLEHFAACLSDFTIFTAAHALKDVPINDAHRKTIAMNIYRAGIEGRVDTDVPEFDPDAALAAFEQRIAFLEWSGPFENDETFVRCLESIVRWAPISDDLKAFDIEYIRNSVRFSWIDVRKMFFDRLDTNAVATDLASVN